MVELPVNALLMVGPTGAGKSPLGDALSLNGLAGRRCHHLDFGSELRGAASRRDPGAFSEEELDFVRGVLERGLLLENEHFPLAEKIILLFLNRSGFSGKDLLILNGIPRHEGQARDIEKIALVRALVVLDCSAEDVLLRVRGNVGGDRTERSDDGIELIGKKIELFRERTAPLVRYYEKTGKYIYRINVTATTTPQEAHVALSSLAAVHPPVTLVAEPPE